MDVEGEVRKVRPNVDVTWAPKFRNYIYRHAGKQMNSVI